MLKRTSRAPNEAFKPTPLPLRPRSSAVLLHSSLVLFFTATSFPRGILFSWRSYSVFFKLIGRCILMEALMLNGFFLLARRLPFFFFFLFYFTPLLYNTATLYNDTTSSPSPFHRLLYSLSLTFFFFSLMSLSSDSVFSTLITFYASFSFVAISWLKRATKLVVDRI